MDEAFGIVEGVVVDHETRMSRAFEQAHQFAQRNIPLDRDDVAARHHDVGDAPLVQAQDIAQHGALDRGEAGFIWRGGVKHHLKIGAGRSRFPSEQRAQRTHEPEFRRRAQHLALLNGHRQIA